MFFLTLLEFVSCELNCLQTTHFFKAVCHGKSSDSGGRWVEDGAAGGGCGGADTDRDGGDCPA